VLVRTKIGFVVRHDYATAPGRCGRISWRSSSVIVNGKRFEIVFELLHGSGPIIAPVTPGLLHDPGKGELRRGAPLGLSERRKACRAHQYTG
jgi:hypothetical protein